MNRKTIVNSLIRENLQVDPDKPVMISVVAYEHPLGIPARFLTGFIPAVSLSKQLALEGIQSIIRVIDPAPIANYCNAWKNEGAGVQGMVSDLLDSQQVQFFFDRAEEISPDALEILGAIGKEICASTDEQVVDLVQRIKGSGEKHGGESGRDNSIIYLAAHPFSWHDLHHSSVWKSAPPPDHTCVNLMSKAENRFTVIRKFVRECRTDLVVNVELIDSYMTVCNTPCYIPLEDEPTYNDFLNNGHEWCRTRYNELKKRNMNYVRAAKDFHVFLSELGLNDGQ